MSRAVPLQQPAGQQVVLHANLQPQPVMPPRYEYRDLTKTGTHIRLLCVRNWSAALSPPGQGTRDEASTGNPASVSPTADMLEDLLGPDEADGASKVSQSAASAADSTKDGDPYFELVEVSLDKPLPFEAISYAWGSQDKTSFIRVAPAATTAGPAESTTTSADTTTSASKEPLLDPQSQPSSTATAALSPVRFQALPITASMTEALPMLLKHSQTGRLWIDQLCINQASTSEREQQVAVMDEIYRAAVRVLIWTGGESAVAKRYIVRGGGSEEYDDDRELPRSEDDKKAMLNFLQRGWFERAWVVQEAVLGRSPVMLAGDFAFTLLDIRDYLHANVRQRALDDNETAIYMDRRDFLSIIMGLRQIKRERRRGNGSATYLEGRGKEEEEEKEEEDVRAADFDYLVTKPYYLLNTMGKCKATDARDHVYAFLGLLRLTWGPAIHVEPDYQLSEAETFAAATRAIAEGMGSLEVFELLRRTWVLPSPRGSDGDNSGIGGRGESSSSGSSSAGAGAKDALNKTTVPVPASSEAPKPPRKGNLPSWAADFSRNAADCPLVRAIQRPLKTGFNADKGRRHIAPKSSLLCGDGAGDDNGTSAAATSATQGTTSAATTTNVKSKVDMRLEVRGKILNGTELTVRLLRHFADNMLENRRVHGTILPPEGLEQIRAAAVTAGYHDRVGRIEDIELRVLRTCVAGWVGLGSRRHAREPEDREAVLKTYLEDKTRVRREHTMSPAYDVESRLTDLGNDMMLWLCAGGRLVLAPNRSLPGDVVAILHGSRLPVVLRRKEGQKTQNEGNEGGSTGKRPEYTVVGLAYLEGAMFGEAVTWGEDQADVITLV